MRDAVPRRVRRHAHAVGRRRIRAASRPASTTTSSHRIDRSTRAVGVDRGVARRARRRAVALGEQQRRVEVVGRRADVEELRRRSRTARTDARPRGDERRVERADRSRTGRSSGTDANASASATCTPTKWNDGSGEPRRHEAGDARRRRPTRTPPYLSGSRVRHHRHRHERAGRRWSATSAPRSTSVSVSPLTMRNVGRSRAAAARAAARRPSRAPASPTSSGRACRGRCRRRRAA